MGYTTEQHELAHLFATGTVTPFVGAGLSWPTGSKPSAAPDPSVQNSGHPVGGLDVCLQATDFLGMLYRPTALLGEDAARKLTPREAVSDFLLLLATLNPPVVFTAGKDKSVAETYQFLKRVYRGIATPWAHIEALRLDRESGSREPRPPLAFACAEPGDQFAGFESSAVWFSRFSDSCHSPLLIGVDFSDSDTREMFARLCCRADRQRWGRTETFILFPAPIPGAHATLQSFGFHPIYLNTYPGASNEARLASFLEGILELAVTMSNKIRPILTRSVISRLHWAVLTKNDEALGVLTDYVEEAEFPPYPLGRCAPHEGGGETAAFDYWWELMTNADASARQTLMRLLLRADKDLPWVKALRCLTFLRYPEVRRLEEEAGYPSLWPSPPLPERFAAILVRDALLWEEKGWFESDTTLYYIGAVEACVWGRRTWRKVIRRYYHGQDWLPPAEWLSDFPEKIDRIQFTRKYRSMDPSWFLWPCFRRTSNHRRQTESENAEIASS